MESGTMPITMQFETMGQLTLARGQTVHVGWELFADEFPPLINHTSMFGFDSGRHIVRVSVVDHEGPDSSGKASFHYSLTNVSTGPAQVVTSQRYIFFKATP
jgi:hypothetical protein